MTSRNLAKFSWLILALLAASASTLSALAETKKEWKASLAGRSTDDRFSSSRTVSLAGLLHIRHDFTEALSANLVGGAVLETGSASALFTSEFSPKSRLLLQEAALSAKLNAFGLNLGALDQSHHASPLWMDGGTFPAVLGSFAGKTGVWKLHLDAQAAIPTSQSLSTRATGKENTPSLISQKLITGVETENFEISARVTHFQFRDLTRGVAQDSRFYGNSVSGVGAASRFVYEFEGFEAGFDLGAHLSQSVKASVGASALQNSKGPRSANRGLYAHALTRFEAKDFAVSPSVEYFRNEADSSPGFYNSAKFGHNNRHGAGAGVKVELPKAGLNLGISGYRSRLIMPRTFQKDRFEYIELTLEIPYASF